MARPQRTRTLQSNGKAHANHRVTAEHHLDSPSPSMWQTPAWSSTWMMSTRTTSVLGRRGPASTASRSISRMVSVNMEHETWKVTGGGLQHR